MSTLKGGGPAFPTGPLNRADTEPGMSLRDWFAGHALVTPLVTNCCGGTWAQQIAQEAYKLADAMLAERAKEPK